MIGWSVKLVIYYSKSYVIGERFKEVVCSILQALLVKEEILF